MVGGQVLPTWETLGSNKGGYLGWRVVGQVLPKVRLAGLDRGWW